jgi:hypothetical protein
MSKTQIHPQKGQVYGPGQEPETVRDAYDKQIGAKPAQNSGDSRK